MNNNWHKLTKSFLSKTKDGPDGKRKPIAGATQDRATTVIMRYVFYEHNYIDKKDRRN